MADYVLLILVRVTLPAFSVFQTTVTTATFFVFFMLTSDFGAINSHFVLNNEHLTLKSRPFRFNVRAAEYVI
jgi:hypothetical protein